MRELVPWASCGLMIIGLGVLITFWFRAMYAFDKLIKYEYENFPDQWEKDRQPHGLFWKPPKNQVKRINRIFQNDPSLKFLFITPDWMKENSEALEHLKEFRK